MFRVFRVGRDSLAQQIDGAIERLRRRALHPWNPTLHVGKIAPHAWIVGREPDRSFEHRDGLGVPAGEEVHGSHPAVCRRAGQDLYRLAIRGERILEAAELEQRRGEVVVTDWIVGSELHHP